MPKSNDWLRPTIIVALATLLVAVLAFSAGRRDDKAEIAELLARARRAVCGQTGHPVASLMRPPSPELLGKLGEAEASLHRILELDPRNSEALALLGISFLHRGQLKEARIELERAIVLNPRYAMAKTALGLVAEKQELLLPALRLLKEATDVEPDNHFSTINLGLAYGRLGQLKLAVEVTKLATKLEPNCAISWGELGKLLSATNDQPGAIKAYRKWLTLQPKSGIAHYLIGETLRSTGNHNKAIYHLKKSITIAPDLLEAHASLGLALLIDDREQEAYEALSHCEQHGHWNYNCNIASGIAARMAGDHIQAEEFLRQAAAIKPASPVPWRELVYVLESPNRVGETGSKTLASLASNLDLVPYPTTNRL